MPMTLLHCIIPAAKPVADSQGSDAEALRSWCDHGDRVRLGEFFTRWQRPAYAIALRLIGDPDEAEDAVQQGFLNAMRRANQWRGQGSAGSWLLAVVANQARDLRRARDRRGLHHFSLSDVVAPPQTERESDLYAAVRRAVDMLPEHERLPLVLHLIDGLDQAAVAAALGRNPGTVRMQLSRGLERLHVILTARGVATGVLLTALTSAIPAADPPVDLSTRSAAAAGGGLPAATVISVWWAPFSIIIAIFACSAVAWRQLAQPSTEIPSRQTALAPLTATGGETLPDKPMDWWVAAGWDPSGPWQEIPASRAFLLARQLPGREQGATGYTLRIGSLDTVEALTNALAQVARDQRASKQPNLRLYANPVLDQGMTLAELVAGTGLRGPAPDRGTLVILASQELKYGESLTPYRLQREGSIFTLVLDEWCDDAQRGDNTRSRHAFAIALGDLPAGTYRLRVAIRRFISYQNTSEEGKLSSLSTYAPIAIDHVELPFAVATQAQPVVLPPDALSHSDSSILGVLRSGRLRPDLLAFQVAAHVDRPDPASISAGIGLLFDEDLNTLLGHHEPDPLRAERHPYPKGSKLVIHGPVGMPCSLRDMSCDDQGSLVVRIDVWPRSSSEQSNRVSVLIPLLPCVEQITRVQVMWSLATPNHDGTCSLGVLESHPEGSGMDGWCLLEALTVPSSPSPSHSRF